MDSAKSTRLNTSPLDLPNISPFQAFTCRSAPPLFQKIFNGQNDIVHFTIISMLADTVSEHLPNVEIL